ncbi:zinc finger protein 830-like protein [Leptotrombidium deliense]|uniref:Zinc finger protein 830-like protein n=1 Tax=Leptotrombidium deliense TaxID=299467 RepID=A0A443SU49_9ACAR|nr:zinc finger protein 830-like protein [Leptotrombidium deliense]
MNKYAINEFKRRAKASDYDSGPLRKQAKISTGKRKGEQKRNEESSKSEVSQTLPADFFDVAKTDDRSENADNGKQMPNEIPKGFFDDPVMDAKARNVAYKDPKEEEWELFQKAISEEKNVSEALVEEELEAVQVERNLEEIDSQIEKWQKVNELQEKAEKIIANSDKDMKEDNLSDDEDTADFDDLNVFSDWRSRGTVFNK